MCAGGSVEDGGLPEEGGELAGAGDGGHALGLAASGHELMPAGVDAALAAPGDLDDAWILARLAARELVADRRPVGVLGHGLDQQPARVGWACLGDRALAALVARGVL